MTGATCRTLAVARPQKLMFSQALLFSTFKAIPLRTQFRYLAAPFSGLRTAPSNLLWSFKLRLLLTAPFLAYVLSLVATASAPQKRSACSLLALSRRVAPNNSFKPMPLRGTA